MLVTLVLVAAILTGCKNPLSSQLWRPASHRESTWWWWWWGSQPSVVWRPTNQLPTCLSSPKACNLEIIVIITPHIGRALSLAFQFNSANIYCVLAM